MIYNFILVLMAGAVRVLSLFNKKVARMSKGEREAFEVLRRKIDTTARYVWFHAASLGEFEQGRPLIEAIRKQHPEYKILQTFFSPSGYEVRKDYKGADVVCYLPIDTRHNARRFIELAHPCMAFFIKYEFWMNYLSELKRREIPVYSVSSIFRPGQVFFRWYGDGYRRVLKTFTYLFVQNRESLELLKGIGIHNAGIVGDTRFDRVLEIRKAAKELPLIEGFKGKSLTFVAGSSWAPDEEIFISYFNRHPEVKLIIAPHVIDDDHLGAITRQLEGRKVVRYTQATVENVQDADCLLIDCFGLLSSIYRYGDVAYVGGGFGAGIHNVLEAAVYGIPVIFGPNNKKFMEAQGLLHCGGGFEITEEKSFACLLDKLLTDRSTLQIAGKAAGDYVRTHAGALQKILQVVKL